MMTFGTYVSNLGSIVKAQAQASRMAYLERRAWYDVYDLYYRNEIYDRTGDGGRREEINTALGNAAASDLAGLYNPVSAVVDLYQQVFSGDFGTDIRVQPTRTGSPAIIPALEQIWQWSNMTIEKQPLCRFAANYGTCGIRIVARDATPMRGARVYLKAEHPGIIRDADTDERGNVIGIQLEYADTFGLGDSQKTVTIREELTREHFATYRIDEGGQAIPYDLEARQDTTEADPRARRPNVLGVVPYVLLSHQYTGDVFGRNAYRRALGAIDRLNALLSHIDIQVHEHVRAAWLVAAAGAPPVEFDLGGRKLIYLDTRGTNGAPPHTQAMVTNLSIADATNQARFQLALIEDLLPELKAIGGRFLSGQSGETIAELRKPAEDALLTARANYEDAMIRAQQIALSYGVLLGVWDIGSGSGSVEAADRAYHTGLEDHTFVARPAFSGNAPAVQPVQQAAPMPMQLTDGTPNVNA